MKLKLLIPSFIVLVTMVFLSCTKEDKITTANENNKEMKLKSGIFSFSDTNALIQHYEWISNNLLNPDVITNYNNQIGLVSAAEIHDYGMSITDSLEFMTFIQTYPNCFQEIMLDDGSIFYHYCPTKILTYTD